MEYKLGEALGDKYSMVEIYELNEEFNDWVGQWLTMGEYMSKKEMNFEPTREHVEKQPIGWASDRIKQVFKILKNKAKKSKKYAAFLKIFEVTIDMPCSPNGNVKFNVSKNHFLSK